MRGGRQELYGTGDSLIGQASCFRTNDATNSPRSCLRSFCSQLSSLPEIKESSRAKPTFGWALPRFGRRDEGWRPLGAFEKFCLPKA
jgi:hypothetical protein